MSNELLRLENLAVGYGHKPLYADVSLAVREGEMVVLLGANGAGKSTLLRCVTGQLAPLSGSILINGRSLATVRKMELARLVSIVRTDQTLAGGLTVEELVGLGRQPHTGFFGRLSHRDRDAVAEALKAVGMTDFAERQVASLSDGERQKVMIARAVAQETPLMVLDEPTAFLDVASRLETLQLLSSLARERGKAVILSSHDVSASLRLASRLWVIIDSCGNGDSGCASRRLVDGTPSELIRQGALLRLFPGRKVAFNPQLLDFLPE
jgi:iron complex transport system ATP-binding protein